MPVFVHASIELCQNCGIEKVFSDLKVNLLRRFSKKSSIENFFAVIHFAMHADALVCAHLNTLMRCIIISVNDYYYYRVANATSRVFSREALVTNRFICMPGKIALYKFRLRRCTNYVDFPGAIFAINPVLAVGRI